MPRAHSLIELTVSILIGLILTASLIQVAKKTVSRFHDFRRGANVSGSVELAAGDLRNRLAVLEPEFWRAFPVDTVPFHEVARDFGGVMEGRGCEGGCLLLWDLSVPRQGVVTYELTGVAGSAVLYLADEEGDAPAAFDEPHVLLFSGPDEPSYCRTAVSSRDGAVHLAPDAARLWRGGEIPDPDVTRIAVLGRLDVLHISVRPDKDRTGVLTLRPQRLSGGAWTAARSTTTYHYIDAMRLHHLDGGPAQWCIVGRAPNAPDSAEPLVLGGHRYQKEVYVAAVEL